MKTASRLIAPLLTALAATPIASAQPAPAPPAPADAAPTTPPAQPAAAPVEPAAAPAQPAAPKPADAGTVKGVEWTSLKLLRAKGVISEEEYGSALKDLGGLPADAGTLMVSKLKLSFFGFAQADFVYNSTQSCQDFCSNFQVAKPGTFRGDHSRVIFSPRDTRFGIRFAAPEENGIRASGVIETDFFGPTTTSEQGTWVNPVLRIRHAYLKLETPIVDVLLGQTWNLFGWAAGYLVAGAQEPGLPGQMFQRTPQLKISKTIKTSAGVTVDVALAALRPPQMDSGLPEGGAGVRIAFDKWTGYHTFYMTSSVTQPASIAITGDLRAFRLAEFSTAPRNTNFKTGGGVAIDAYLPIIPATKTSHDNALAVSGELVIGRGTSDMYTALGAGGTSNAAIPPAMPGGTPGTYTPNFDAGLAAYDANGNAELIKWTSYIVGVEYYPPGVGGRLGLFGSYGHMESSNSKNFGGAQVTDPVAGRTRESENYYSGGAFVDPTKQVRIGSEFGLYDDHYVDGTVAKNYSLILSGFLFF